MTEYISKAEVLEFLEGYSLGHALMFGDRHGEVDFLAKKINEIFHSDSDVAPVIHARWIDNGRSGYAHAYFCSHCGWLDGYPIEDRHKYCPNCGAKIDESEDEE